MPENQRFDRETFVIDEGRGLNCARLSWLCNVRTIKRIGVALAIVLFGGMTALAASAQSAVLIQSDVNPAKCFQKTTRGWGNGIPIHLWDCAAGPDENKVWIFDEASGYIRGATNPDKCLHKQSGGWRNGNQIHVWDCDAGTTEMKTWIHDEETKQIKGLLSSSSCLHKRDGGWNNGNPIHIWDCSAGRREMKTWSLTSYLFVRPTCEQVESLGPALAAQVREVANEELSGESVRISRRKTFRVNSVASVEVSNCRARLVLDSTLRRKIRRNAHGTVELSARVDSISEQEVCLSDFVVDEVDLSATARIGESVYRWVANLFLEGNGCFSVDTST